MAKTLDEGFRLFLSWLTPTSTETQAAKNHRKSINDCLVANLGMTNFFRTGSFGNGTSISGHSDVDYFAVIPTGNLNEASNRSLDELTSILDDRFPNTRVRLDCPAVVGADDSETTEVVPVNFVGQNKYKLDNYEMPNGANGWMISSPDTHNTFVKQVDDKLSGKVKPLIRFVKAWKYFNEVPISSFYLEMFVATYASTEQSIVYHIDLKNCFALLKKVNLSPISDPTGISANLSASKDFVSTILARDAITAAVIRTDAACSCETAKDTARAFMQYSVLFNDQFPGY